MSKYSVNALKYFTEKQLDHYVAELHWIYEDSDEELEANWLEGEIGSEGEYVVNVGSYIIADGLTELEVGALLDELQAEIEN